MKSQNNFTYTIRVPEFGVNQTTTHGYRREADTLLKKYSNEIVVYDKPMSFTSRVQRSVYEFSDMLKLAINLNKHIMCYRDENHTGFVVLVDGVACLYVINYKGGESESGDKLPTVKEVDLEIEKMELMTTSRKTED